MSQYDAEMQQAIRLAVIAKLPLTAATIVVVHVLPTLFVWGLPELRRGIVYAAWIALTTIGAGIQTMTVGPVEVKGEMKTFWSPLWSGISMGFNLVVVCAIVYVLSRPRD
jgi:hypothetical protein